MIRSREISDEFRNFFNVLWEHAGGSEIISADRKFKFNSSVILWRKP